jgi:hypothetical protein
MRRDELIKVQRTNPFRPFRLHLSGGTSYDIRHPEMLMVTRHTVIVGLVENGDETDAGGEGPYIERATTVDLLHVTQVEELPQSNSRPS